VENKMAKKNRQVTSAAPTRKQLSRNEKEQKQLRLLYIGAGVLAAIIVVILGIGLYQELVAKPRRALATVAGVPVRADAFSKMLAYTRLNLENNRSQITQQMASLGSSTTDKDTLQYITQYYQQQLEYIDTQLENAPAQVLQDMIDDELVRQETTRLNLAVSEQEITDEIEIQFGFDRNPPTPTPTPVTATLPITVTPTPTLAPMTEEEFKTRFGETLTFLGDEVGFSEAEVRNLFRNDLLRRKLQEHLEAQVPTTALQIHARHILLETQEDADKALARVKAGEDFATVAQEVSTDESTKESGGDLGWFPLGQMVADFEKVAFNTPVGQISEVVPTEFGFHIIKVEERDENRALDEYALQQAKSGVLDTWLEGQRTSPDVVRLVAAEDLPNS